MNLERRNFFKKILLGSGVVMLAGNAKLATAGKSTFPGLESLFSNRKIAKSGDITIDLPVYAENGRSVPISVSTTLPDVEEMSVVIKGNKNPKAFTLKLDSKTVPNVETHINVEKTTDVIAVVKSKGKLYSTSVDILVNNPYNCS